MRVEDVTRRAVEIVFEVVQRRDALFIEALFMEALFMGGDGVTWRAVEIVLEVVQRVLRHVRNPGRGKASVGLLKAI